MKTHKNMKTEQNEKELVTVKSTDLLECLFTEIELKTLSNELACKIIEKTELENKKKSALSDFTGQLNDMKAEINLLANKINTGKEYRNVDCIITMNSPSTGLKTAQRLDTKENIWTKEMTAEELQTEISFDTPIKLQDANKGK